MTKLEALRAVEEKGWKEEIDAQASQPVDAGPAQLTAFQRRFRTTALEAHSRELISSGKLRELGRRIDLSEAELERLEDEYEGMHCDAEA